MVLDGAGSRTSLTSGEGGRKRNGLEQLKLGSLGVQGAEVGLVVGSWIFAILIGLPERGAQWAAQNSEKLFGDHGHMVGI